MKLNPRAFSLALIFLMAITLLVIVLLADIFPGTSQNSVLVIVTFISLLVGTTGILFTYETFSRDRLPISYNIAIIGFPKSGKTTLITSIFSEIFQQKFAGIDMQITSESTIERINENLRRIESGVAVGPTTSQDRFSYTTLIRRKKQDFFIPSRAFMVEFGDFPGEDSESYMTEYGPWLHNTPFYKWVYSAQAFIFVIDLSLYLDELGAEPNKFTPMVSAAIRAAWQNILLSKEINRDELRGKPVVLAFSKSDLLISKTAREVYINNKTNDTKGFIEKVPLPFLITGENASNLQLEEQKVINDFANLIAYLSGETKKLRVVFVSGFATLESGKLGIRELLRAVLPINLN